jgi:hypothetical protein
MSILEILSKHDWTKSGPLRTTGPSLWLIPYDSLSCPIINAIIGLLIVAPKNPLATLVVSLLRSLFPIFVPLFSYDIIKPFFTSLSDVAAARGGCPYTSRSTPRTPREGYPGADPGVTRLGWYHHPARAGAHPLPAKGEELPPPAPEGEREGWALEVPPHPPPQRGPPKR